MMFGLGQTSTTVSTAATTATFGSGIGLWTSPSSALSAMGTLISNPTTSYSSGVLPFTLGVLLPPIALIALVLSMGKGKKR